METNKDKSSSCDVAVTCDDVRCFFINWFGIELVLCDLYLTRFDLTKDLLFDTFFRFDLTKDLLFDTFYIHVFHK